MKAGRDGRQATATFSKQHYLLGGSFSAADRVLMTYLDGASVYGFALTEVLESYRSRIHARPAYRSAAKLNFSISSGV